MKRVVFGNEPKEITFAEFCGYQDLIVAIDKHFDVRGIIKLQCTGINKYMWGTPLFSARLGWSGLRNCRRSD
jgi:hypothetical protein